MDKLLERIKQIHIDCHILCNNTFGKYINVAGNIGIFCQDSLEFSEFSKLKDILTKTSDNPNQKYFKLREPIKIDSKDSVPAAIYTFLYIRKPDTTPYGKYFGDIDFIMNKDLYDKFKSDVLEGKYPAGVKVYDRPSWDTIQITSTEVSSVAYISTSEFAEKVRVKFD